MGFCPLFHAIAELVHIWWYNLCRRKKLQIRACVADLSTGNVCVLSGVNILQLGPRCEKLVVRHTSLLTSRQQFTLGCYSLVPGEDDLCLLLLPTKCGKLAGHLQQGGSNAHDDPS